MYDRTIYSVFFDSFFHSKRIYADTERERKEKEIKGYVSTSGLKLAPKFAQRTSQNTSDASTFVQLQNLLSLILIGSIGIDNYLPLVYIISTIFGMARLFCHDGIARTTRPMFELLSTVVFLIVASIKR